LTTPGVTSIVSFGDAPAALEDKEIDDLKTLVGSGFPIRPWPFLNAGQRISIERGPLKGLEGIILRIKDSYHLVASVFILQRSVAVEVDAAFVRPHPARLGIA
jgi:transcription antitermination factor NusG